MASGANTGTLTHILAEGQRIILDGGPGTFTLTFNGSTTGALPFGASAVQVAAALNALDSVIGVGGTAAVTLSGRRGC